MLSESNGFPLEMIPSRTFQPSLVSQWDTLGASAVEMNLASKRMSRSLEPPIVKPISEEMAHISAHSNTKDAKLAPGTDSHSINGLKIPEGYMLVPIGSATANFPSACTCGCHDTLLPRRSRPTFTNASIQTDTLTSPPRNTLRIDTVATSKLASKDYGAVSQADFSPPYGDYPAENPIYMGKMMTSYFSKPGYQLGDSLVGGYQAYEMPLYQYQDEFGDEALR
jgi:hypothetical protein